MSALVVSLLLVADVVCAESGRDWPDAELVGAVVVNRSRAWGRPLAEVVTRPGQFAAGCSEVDPGRLHWRHLSVSARAHLGRLRRPRWMDQHVLYFCSEPRGGCNRWSWLDRLERAGASSAGHVYYRPGRGA